ncbi:hypothetical protein [Microbacterium laevaniformans]|uniref:hypothetical protein n=1 Tax=Microbacterium laevaniformans TaxID=36807 RepID=UPI003D99F349
MSTILPKRTVEVTSIDGGNASATGEVLSGGDAAGTGTSVYDGGNAAMQWPIRPIAVKYESTRDVPTIVHPVIGKSTPMITIRPGQLRTGTIELWFRDEHESLHAEQEHARGTTMQMFTAVDTVDMYYVAVGRVERRLDDRGGWVVTVEYVEVTPELTYSDLSAALGGTYSGIAAALPQYSQWSTAWEYTGAAVG